MCTLPHTTVSCLLCALPTFMMSFLVIPRNCEDIFNLLISRLQTIYNFFHVCCIKIARVRKFVIKLDTFLIPLVWMLNINVFIRCKIHQDMIFTKQYLLAIRKNLIVCCPETFKSLKELVRNFSGHLAFVQLVNNCCVNPTKF